MTEAVDYSHPAFEIHAVRFTDDTKKYGLEGAYERWTYPSACGCMGPRGDEPLCSCQMRVKTAERFMTRRLIPTEEGKALLNSPD